ncbi:Response regulator receiver protein [Burkholderiales bacterium]|nr:Response regulator receiver protein [Burkholderiales bacterium]
MSDSQEPATKLEGSVFLVEDDAAVRRSLSLLLRLHGYGTEEFDSAEQFLATTVHQRPACALVDIRLPGMSGLSLQARMIRQERGFPVLLMTAQGDISIARTALLQGAVDFLEKPIDEKELLEAVSAALRSDTEQLARHREHDALLARIASLTRHEWELFERITNGLSYREIAEDFGLTLEAFELQRARLMEKLDARRLADLFRLRFRVGERASGRRMAL